MTRAEMLAESQAQPNNHFVRIGFEDKRLVYRCPVCGIIGYVPSKDILFIASNVLSAEHFTAGYERAEFKLAYELAKQAEAK